MIRTDELINQNINLVKNIALDYSQNKTGIEYEDLISYGVIALLDAINTFNESKGVKFSTYACIRVRSYLIDEIRRQSPISRYSISKVKLYLSCEEYLQQKYLRQPTVDEISKYMKISINEVNKIKTSGLNLSPIYSDSIVLDNETDLKLTDMIKDESINVEEYIERKELKLILKKSINMLNEIDRFIINQYYYEGKTLKEIGELLDISTSRSYQLKKKAILNLKSMMKKLNYLN
ncbi:RNA polymerase sigma factor for flagellar operon FliA,Sigma-28,RNA polymerase sigma factor WhiG,RNA polymerase sigma factor, FliA/WhiG family,Sigma-70, region 4 [[Clostridium] sordellii]|uniref:sigma-70 family RNA polymerase sigma factor n=1 Tax=Paraclostridium sordellii TaxID=1505 RepID=UPI00054289CB|nr:sigma-70 family RNA polymerase sigma factor [Paeniclostridium sordellii]CEK35413.1 RNA polymerase sigma factor for flagellar operon FliA,Sigma-28,RNA polymerase sigma factor WhiG,RNA polymerase sigma factor, FliA/WhiG family,Sigma-70, region 4 [[Clostridium] sordellii] [Paeniclostridium sordellii]